MADFSGFQRPGEVNQTGGAMTGLFKDIYSNEVITAFEENTIMLDKHFIRTIKNGKSASFPVIGRTTAAYHTAGAMLLGDKVVKGNEKIIGIDGLLLSDIFVANIDEMMNHWDVRGPYAAEQGRALAQSFDKNVIAEGVLGARASALVTGLPNGSAITDGDVDSATLATRAGAFAKACFTAAAAFDANSVPEEDRYLVIRPTDYYAMVQNTDAINRDWGGAGAYSDGKILRVAGIKLLKSANVQTGVNYTTDVHDVDMTYTYGLFFTPTAIGTVKLLDLAFESEYLIRNQGHILVAKYAMGHSWIRPECLIELKHQ
jgi:hypothetical protein